MTQAFPFLAAAVMFLLSSLFVRRAKRQVMTWIDAARPYAPAPPEQIPDYLAPEQLDAYLEYATDVVQVVPAMTMTAVGVVVAMPGHYSTAITAAFAVGVVASVFIVDTYVLTLSPQRYLRARRLGISWVAALGIALNAIAFVLVLVASP